MGSTLKVEKAPAELSSKCKQEMKDFFPDIYKQWRNLRRKPRSQMNEGEWIQCGVDLINVWYGMHSKCTSLDCQRMEKDVRILMAEIRNHFMPALLVVKKPTCEFAPLERPNSATSRVLKITPGACSASPKVQCVILYPDMFLLWKYLGRNSMLDGMKGVTLPRTLVHVIQSKYRCDATIVENLLKTRKLYRGNAGPMLALHVDVIANGNLEIQERGTPFSEHDRGVVCVVAEWPPKEGHSVAEDKWRDVLSVFDKEKVAVAFISITGLNRKHAKALTSVLASQPKIYTSSLVLCGLSCDIFQQVLEEPKDILLHRHVILSPEQDPLDLADAIVRDPTFSYNSGFLCPSTNYAMQTGKIGGRWEPQGILEVPWQPGYEEIIALRTTLLLAPCAFLPGRMGYMSSSFQKNTSLPTGQNNIPIGKQAHDTGMSMWAVAKKSGRIPFQFNKTYQPQRHAIV